MHCIGTSTENLRREQDILKNSKPFDSIFKTPYRTVPDSNRDKYANLLFLECKINLTGTPHDHRPMTLICTRQTKKTNKLIHARYVKPFFSCRKKQAAPAVVLFKMHFF